MKTKDITAETCQVLHKQPNFFVHTPCSVFISMLSQDEKTYINPSILLLYSIGSVIYG